MTTRMLTATLVLSCSVLLGAQVDDLFVNDPRPMAAMVKKIQEQTGLAITYEDPLYEFMPDTQEDGGQADGKPFRRVRDVPFVFTLDDAKRKDVVKAVRELADHFELRTGGQTFKVIVQKGYIHIVPQLNKNAQGVFVEQRPALDTRISLPAGKRSLMDFMIEFTHVLSTESEQQIDLGTMSINSMINTQVELPAFKNTPARDVLREALSHAPVKLSWRLLGGFGVAQQALNVRPVGARNGDK
jgi:hypothetical protein